MGLPAFPVEGGCQCGAVRYRLKASPLSVYNCHCKDCQRYSGAAWSMSMIVRDGDFEVLSGEVERYDRRADSGNVIAMNFCRHCHTWLWNDPPSGEIERADDDRQHVVEIVRDTAGQLADRFHLLQLADLRLASLCALAVEL